MLLQLQARVLVGFRVVWPAGWVDCNIGLHAHLPTCLLKALVSLLWRRVGAGHRTKTSGTGEIPWLPCLWKTLAPVN